MACHRIRGPKSRPPANPQKGASGSPKPTFSRDRPAHPHSPQTVQHLGQQRLLPTTPSPHHPPPPTSATQAQLAKATGATVGAQDDARANKQAPRRAGRRLPDTPTNPSTRTDLPNHFWESPQNSQRPAHSPPPPDRANSQNNRTGLRVQLTLFCFYYLPSVSRSAPAQGRPVPHKALLHPPDPLFQSPSLPGAHHTPPVPRISPCIPFTPLLCNSLFKKKIGPGR